MIESLFTSATKIVTIIVIIAEGSLYGVSVYGGLLSHPSLIPVLIGQLVGASIVVMYLDELIQKGWGLGSGISLFIMAGGSRNFVEFVQSTSSTWCLGTIWNISIHY